MADIDNIKFSSILFTRISNTLFSIQANFNFGGSSLGVSDAQMMSYNEFRITFDGSGSDSLNSEILFAEGLQDPASNPNVQNSVVMKFYDAGTGVYSSKKGNNKISGNKCPPPGEPSELVGLIGNLDDYGASIKTINLQRTGGTTEVTVTTENLNGEPTGYRIVGNMEHIIETGSGPVHTWAFEIEEDKTVDADNTFQFDFSTVDAEVGLPILFYKKGTDVNNVHQSDALLWIEQ